jgi:hypothetical protein
MPKCIAAFSYSNMKSIFFSSIIVVITSFCTYAQSGWVKSKGTFFTKLDYTSLKSNNYYSPSGLKFSTNYFFQNSFNFYGEYGLTDKITLMANMPLIRTNSFETTEKVTGIGDPRLEIKYGFLRDKWPVALSFGVELPIGRSVAFAKSLSDPTEGINLPIGDGEFNMHATLAASKSFGIGYLSAFGAYNYRTTYEGLAFVDLYQLGIEVGFNPFKDFWINTKLRGQFATKATINPTLGFVRGDGTTYTINSFEAFYKITQKIGISATYLTGGSSISALKNIYASPFYSIGIIYEKK